ncbi:MAG TPA: hypothetical protein VGQ39_16355 [Pyrinomonadaceae bacterium]|jgi:hypothetical protein|nr:hypothetical protein [Pyrinomonadaceae bacterium]
MGINFKRRFLPLALAALILFTLCPVHARAKANDGPTETITFVYGSLGIARGQTARYSWAFLLRRPTSANLNETEPEFETIARPDQVAWG